MKRTEASDWFYVLMGLIIGFVYVLIYWSFNSLYY